MSTTEVSFHLCGNQLRRD